MRITQYHAGVPVIPKSKIKEAAEKLASYEDLEVGMNMQNNLRELAEQQDGILYVEQVESWIEEIVEQLEEELELAEKQKEECVLMAVPYYDRTEGYIEATTNAIEIVKGGVENEKIK